MDMNGDKIEVQFVTQINLSSYVQINVAIIADLFCIFIFNVHWCPVIIIQIY